MRVIVYYVSGHGYGHFTRSATIMKSLLDQNIADRIVVRTRVSEEVFSRVLPPFPYYRRRRHHQPQKMEEEGKEEGEEEGWIIRSEPPHELDAGTVQSSPLDVDPISTLRDLVHTFQTDRLETALCHEIGFLSSSTVPLSSSSRNETNQTIPKGVVIAVLSDASPLGIEAAHRSNLPGILVSNFDWCGIYEPFFQQHLLTSQQIHEPTPPESHSDIDTPSSAPSFRNQCRLALDVMAKMYQNATMVIRPRAAVPSTVTYDKGRTRVVDVPWICPEVLRKNIASSTRMERVVVKENDCRTEIGHGVLRKRLESVLFGSGKYDGEEYCVKIVLVTFGGQKGTFGNGINVPTATATPTVSSSCPTNARTNIHKRTNETERIKLGYIYATFDAQSQIDIHVRRYGSSCPAITATDAFHAFTTSFNNNDSDDGAANIDPSVRTIAGLTSLVDVVLCKPGYGTVCETLASCGTMVYVRREPEFVEELSLVGEFVSMGGIVVDKETKKGEKENKEHENEGSGADHVLEYRRRPVAVRLDRESFERRDWDGAILEALRVGGGERGIWEERGILEDKELCGAEVIANILKVYFKFEETKLEVMAYYRSSTPN